MCEPLILTFAEIEFLARTGGGTHIQTVRERLRMKPEVASDIVAAAGLASLLARGLYTMSGSEVAPSGRMLAAAAGLSTSEPVTELMGWVGERVVVMHLFSAPAARLAVYPAAYGQFSVEFLDPTEPCSVPVLRFLDACSRGEGLSAVILRTRVAGNDIAVAVARDESGRWYLSDSLDSADRGTPTARDAVERRLVDLMGPSSPVGASAG